jgi:hypothetical protein
MVGEHLEPIVEGECLLETTPFCHGRAPVPAEEGGSATGVLITDDCHGSGR